jgi:hypothetical protein
MTDVHAELDDLEAALLPVTGLVLSAPVLPGFLLCVPALSMAAVAVLVPLVAVALLLAIAGATVAIPVLLVRAARSRLAAPPQERVRALAADL